MLRTLFALFFSALTLSQSLQIDFRPSTLLLRMSSKPSFGEEAPFNLHFREWILKTELWPLIAHLASSKSFNFPQLMIPVLNRLTCHDKIELLRNEKFPKKLVFTADVLSSMSMCFSHCDNPGELKALLPVNPAESRHFRPSQWPSTSLQSFLERGWLEDRKEMRWSSWTADRTLHYTDFAFKGESWHLFNVISVAPLAKKQFDLVVALINPIPHLSDRLALKSMRPTEAATMMARTLSLFAFYLRFAADEEWRDPVSEIINGVSVALDQNVQRSAFPDAFYGLFELINERQPVFVTNFDRSLALNLQQLLDFITPRLKGIRSIWILNVIYIWINFAHRSLASIESDLFPLLRVFFAPERKATAEDVCHLMRLLNTDAQNRALMPKLTEKVSQHFLLPLRSKFKFLIFEECRAELPRSFRLSLPFQARFQSALKQARAIQQPAATDYTVDFSAGSVSFAADLFKDTLSSLNSPMIDSSLLSPMNQHARIYNPDSESFTSILPFRSVLEFLFSVLMEVRQWFVSVSYHASDRPVLVPSLTMPVQLLEALGYLLGRAVLYGLRIPFVLELNYLRAVELSLNECEWLVYVLYKVEGHCHVPEVFAVFSAVNMNSDSVISRLNGHGDFEYDSDDDFSADLDEIERFRLQEKKHVGLDRSDLAQLMMTGVDRLMAGLGEVIPVDNFTASEIHQILFNK